MRLDDASEHMDISKWGHIEEILDKYNVKPIFGIIPKNGDETQVPKYEYNKNFWNLVHKWIDKGWIPAMHGYEHKYITTDGGINPVNRRSEFAGVSYEKQAEKIKLGYRILVEHDIQPRIFFAPSHTFDENTLKAIKDETPIRIISDTIAWDIYKEGDFWFIPQQSGHVRKLPFRTVTFCYHPNTLNEKGFEILENYLCNNKHFAAFSDELLINREKTIIDRMISQLYMKAHARNL